MNFPLAVGRFAMHDHLKAAAIAAAMSDDELHEAYRRIDSSVELSSEEQAVLDELQRRGLIANETAKTTV